MSIQIKRDVEINLTAKDIAEAFSEMGSNEQADVLRHFAEICFSWAAHGRDMHWHYLGKSIKNRAWGDKEREMLESIAREIKQ